MKKIQVLLLIILLCVADIFLYRKGLLPLEPSVSLIPVFFIISFLNDRKEMGYFVSSHSSKIFLSFLFLSIVFSITATYKDPWYTIANHFLSFAIYGFAYVYFKKINDKTSKIIFLAAFSILLLSIAADYLIGTEIKIRGAGFAENPNNAALRIIQLWIVLSFIIKEKKHIIILMIISFIFVFLTLSRSGLIILIVANILIISIKFGKINRLSRLPFYLIKIVPFILIFMFFLLSLVPEIIKLVPSLDTVTTAERIGQLTGESAIVGDGDVGEGGRVSIAKDYLEFFIDYPFGYGTGSSMDRDFYKKATHNMFLREAIDYGFIGLLIILFFIFKGISKSISYGNFYALSFYLAFLVSCFFTNGLFENRTFIICLAFIDAKNIFKHKEKIDD